MYRDKVGTFQHELNACTSIELHVLFVLRQERTWNQFDWREFLVERLITERDFKVLPRCLVLRYTVLNGTNVC